MVIGRVSGGNVGIVSSGLGKKQESAVSAESKRHGPNGLRLWVRGNGGEVHEQSNQNNHSATVADYFPATTDIPAVCTRENDPVEKDGGDASKRIKAFEAQLFMLLEETCYVPILLDMRSRIDQLKRSTTQSKPLPA